MSNIIENNKVASIHYRLLDNDTQEVLDESHQPLEFLVGKENIIPGLEKELLGLKEGQEKDVLVAPENGYGVYDDENLQEVPKEQFSELDLKEGMTIYAHDEEGQTRPVIIKSFDNEKVIVDYNHPLSGKNLMFYVSVVGVREASSDELASGFPVSPDSGGCCGSGGGCGDSSCDSEPSKNDSCCSGEGGDNQGGCCS
jgi:FKBP-type peptidyl-prolyl cis-trans isomerase SlyD